MKLLDKGELKEADTTGHGYCEHAPLSKEAGDTRLGAKAVRDFAGCSECLKLYSTAAC